MGKQTDTQAAPRKTKKRHWLGALIMVAVAGGAAYAVIERPWEPKPKAVAVEIVKPGPVEQVLAVNGRVAAQNSVTVRAAVSAQALSVSVDIGEAVREGDILVELDAALAEAQAEQARAALDAQQVRQRQAETAAQRTRALGENTPRSTLEDAELSLAGAINETARLQAALEQANRQVAQYTIKAPMSGIILTRGVDAGQMVDAQTQLFVIADTSSLVVETDVDELYSSRVQEGLKALLKPVGASIAQHGTVTLAAPTVDSATGGRAIKIAFDEPVDLPVGLTVNANVIVDAYEDVLSIPRSAVVTEGADSHVLVIADGLAVARVISFNDWPADRVVVTEGLAPDDVVILDPAGLEPGDAVAAR